MTGKNSIVFSLGNSVELKADLHWQKVILIIV